MLTLMMMYDNRQLYGKTKNIFNLYKQLSVIASYVLNRINSACVISKRLILLFQNLNKVEY